tara:strand:- start:11094 stop:12671 length:1578 start_codon:yes stop_codon:yes gene_type:complete
MKLVNIFAGHDSNITFYDTEKQKIHIIELERLVRKRYFRLHVDNDLEAIRNILLQCKDIAKKFWDFSNPDHVIVTADGGINPLSVLAEVFETNSIGMVKNHHECHASCAYYLSPHKEALIFSFDGGGNDGFFNVYHAKENQINLLEKVESDFGGGYMLGASILHEISDNSRHQLALPGKSMGLCAYGEAKDELVPHFKEFFFDRDYKKLSELTGLDLLNTDDPWKNPMSNAKFSGQSAYDLAATLQKGYEEAFIDVFARWKDRFPSAGICFTGGGSLNVLLNERVKNQFGVTPYVPPNPNDCGLSLGAAFLVSPPENRPIVTYSGIPLLDKQDLEKHVSERGAKKVNLAEVAQLIKSGKIVGLVYGDSEVGPRALGNRSIVCDPSYQKMKDSLNAKVKFREWYRPFAPFCKKEEAGDYFESSSFDSMEYMSFAPVVKKEYQEVLPAITHIDGTSRLQTVTREDHEVFYDLLTEFGKISDTNVLLNTSFNIRGFPILTTIADALHVLDNTELDYVVVENYLFSKER